MYRTATVSEVQREIERRSETLGLNIVNNINFSV